MPTVKGKMARDLAKKAGLKMPKKANKYKAVKTTVDGIEFASRREATRYTELTLRETAGEITDLELQPRFPVRIGGVDVFVYFADFRYHDNLDGRWVVEDSKGFRTAIYRLKKRCVEAAYRIKIIEV